MAIEYPIALILLKGKLIRLLEIVTVIDVIYNNLLEQRKVILKEIRVLRDTKTYKIYFSKPLYSRKLILLRLVLKNKLINNIIIKKKVRLVIKGFKQKYSLNYFDIFTKVIYYTIL